MTTVLQSLNQGLLNALMTDENVIIIGEDILDPYGGAFKVTRGLSSRFPERVITSPISEAAITGLASGMALRGLRPVVEIMFGDFITLATDQVINHAAKFRWMYNDQVRVPWILRTPMGGRRGYGPTHSQSLEKLFLGIPGLRLIAAPTVGDPGKLLEKLILTTEDPVIFIENKIQYNVEVGAGFDEFQLISYDDSADTHTYLVEIRDTPTPAITLATYGYMTELARQAMLMLAFEEEIFAQMVIYEQISPINIDPLLFSVKKTGRLLTIEEGNLPSGWGAEVLAKTAEIKGFNLKAAARLGAAQTPIPSSGPLEESSLPGVQAICNMVRGML